MHRLEYATTEQLSSLLKSLAVLQTKLDKVQSNLNTNQISQSCS